LENETKLKINDMTLNEADTCRVYVTPKLKESGWDNLPQSFTEQYTFTDGRIEVVRDIVRRGEQKRADYLLKYTRDFSIAVVEAKPEGVNASTGMQQAKDYAEILGLKFAYATNGHEILEFDYTTGLEKSLANFPSPGELFTRLTSHEKINDNIKETLLSPYHNMPGYTPRYYQRIAINRAVQEVLQHNRRLLITMATGTGKTLVAFQICWKLWSARWNKGGEYRKPRILFLADRNVLIDDPKDKTFTPFGDARYKIENGEITKSREMYFAIYQAIAKDERRPGLYKEFSPDFFDLIIVDECHRGSSRNDSSWREILEYFEPAFQIGMTATPLREDNRDTYNYFGNPIYTYSLKQGIDDGFLAPYRVHRVITNVDAAGWRPSKGEVDRYGREIPDGEYYTKDFERLIALRSRTQAIAEHLSEFMKRTDRFAKTIVFCVNQEHADEMRRALNNLNHDIVKQHPNYVARVTSEEGKIGKGHLSRFQELETSVPVILTTSQLLTTGVDAPTCKNIVLARIVNSMSEFKQIIGRGTRLREDYGKFWFNIIDYTGSATQNFADPDFDGYPDIEETVNLQEALSGIHNDTDEQDVSSKENVNDETSSDKIVLDKNNEPKRYYIDGGSIKIVAHVVYELDSEGKQLQVIQYTDYTAIKVRTMFKSLDELRDGWANPISREEIITRLEDNGVYFKEIIKILEKPDSDPFDLLCYLAFDAPLRTRNERASYLRKNKPDFFDQYGVKARKILCELLDKYIEHGPREFDIPDSLQVSPISRHGNVMEIADMFGGAKPMREAVNKLQALLYL
jgi:type I restriction enzyme R subunit